MQNRIELRRWKHCLTIGGDSAEGKVRQRSRAARRARRASILPIMASQAPKGGEQLRISSRLGNKYCLIHRQPVPEGFSAKAQRGRAWGTLFSIRFCSMSFGKHWSKGPWCQAQEADSSGHTARHRLDTPTSQKVR